MSTISDERLTYDDLDPGDEVEVHVWDQQFGGWDWEWRRVVRIDKDEATFEQRDGRAYTISRSQKEENRKFRPVRPEPEPPREPTKDEKQDTMCALVVELEKALRSKRLTVQVMHDGIEIIHVETGDLERKLMLTEVSSDERETE